MSCDCANNNQKQPLPEDLVKPKTMNTTDKTATPDYATQGLDRYEVPPDNEIPEKEGGASGQVPGINE